MGRSLHIRNVPDGVVERVKRAAIQNRRSINSEIVSTLELHYASDDSATQLAIIDDSPATTPFSGCRDINSCVVTSR